VTLLAIRLFLSGALSKLWKWLTSLSFWQLVSLGLAVYCGLQFFELRHARAEAAKWEKQFTAEHNGRLADRQSYQRAQTQAVALNDQKIAKAKQQQKDISDAQVGTLNQRLALIASELQREQNAAASGHPGSTQTGDASTAPCIAFSSAWMCLSPADRLLAAENEERHDELIDWTLKQATVDPNKNRGSLGVEMTPEQQREIGLAMFQLGRERAKQ
jgi:hypothetical protein